MKAHRRLCHSILGSRVLKNQKKNGDAGNRMSVLLNLPGVPIVSVRVSIWGLERPLRDFGVVQTAKLTQFFREIDLFSVYSQAIKRPKERSKGTPESFSSSDLGALDVWVTR